MSGARTKVWRAGEAEETGNLFRALSGVLLWSWRVFYRVMGGPGVGGPTRDNIRATFFTGTDFSGLLLCQVPKSQ